MHNIENVLYLHTHTSTRVLIFLILTLSQAKNCINISNIVVLKWTEGFYCPLDLTCLPIEQ